ncbi:hypothetical protein [Natranaeroarchaeum sulfidigenes]|nr:hypothetical protein [Natranaeroarchaeum sulfidigenes]
MGVYRPMTGGGYRYELTCKVDPEHERAYRNTMAESVLRWFAIERLGGFRPLAELDGNAVRIQFEFPDRQALDTFVSSEANQKSLAALRSVCERVESHCWEPGAVTLDSGSSSVSPQAEMAVPEEISE